MKRSLFKNILLSFGAVILVAGLGALFVNLGLDWFDGLNKPSQFVPSFVFGIVWSVIYLATAIILFLWLKNGQISTKIALLFIINGLLNVVWCLLFFTLHLTLVGLIAIVLNLIFAFKLLIEIKKDVPLFALILSIYSVWISIATCLNLALWILN